jgi:hypothetical protein
MTTQLYALFDDETDYKKAYVEAEREGLIADSENLRTCENIEDEDDVPFNGTSMGVETFGFALGGLLIGALAGNVLARLPSFFDVPTHTVVLLTTMGTGFFGFLAGIFIGVGRVESHRKALWKSFRPGNLAVLLDMRHKGSAERLASIFSRHRARLVEVV